MSTNVFGPILQAVFLIAFAPALAGWINWLKARGQGRKRKWATILQPYRDLWKLLHVPAVRPQTASWVFSLTPWVVFIAYTWLAFSLPVFSQPLLKIDIIVVIYVLGLARFTLSLAGWDAGAAFGGLGSSREMFFHFLTEIGLFLVLAALALRWDTVNLTEIIKSHAEMFSNLIQVFSNLQVFLNLSDGLDDLLKQLIEDLWLIFIAVAFASLILLEAERIPVDNPETHLELTMAHKAITLEFAGRDLALIEWAEMVKMLFLFTLFANLFLPFHNLLQENIGLALASFVIEIIFLGSLLALWELRQPKTRLRQVSRLASWSSMLFSMIAIVLVIITRIIQ